MRDNKWHDVGVGLTGQVHQGVEPSRVEAEEDTGRPHQRRVVSPIYHETFTMQWLVRLHSQNLEH
jgi:hypothetical protein